MSQIAAAILPDQDAREDAVPPIVNFAGICALAAAPALALVSPVLAAGAAYAGVFWLIARRWPALALAAAFAVAPFQNDLSSGGPMQDDAGGGGGGVRFSLAEVNLALALPVFVLLSLQSRRLLRLGPMSAGVGIYLGVCAVSALVNWHASAVTSFMQMIIYLVIAMAMFAYAVSAGMNLRPAFYGLVLISVVLATAVLVLQSGFVFDMHKNGVGGSLALGVVVCAELWLSDTSAWRRWLLAGAMLIVTGGLIFTLSRGGWVEAAVGLLVVMVMRRRVALALKLAMTMVLVVSFTWKYLPDESKDYAGGFDSDRENIRLRYDSIDYALAQFQQDPIFGAGLGLRKEYDATNVVLLTLAETGVPGLLAFLFLHLAFFKLVWKIQGLLSREDPRFYLLSLGAALVPAKFAHGLVDHYWSRGTIMLCWASAGMTLGVYFLIERSIESGAVVFDGEVVSPEASEEDSEDDTGAEAQLPGPTDPEDESPDAEPSPGPGDPSRGPSGWPPPWLLPPQRESGGSR
jgi:hypothetical protein